MNRTGVYFLPPPCRHLDGVTLDDRRHNQRTYSSTVTNMEGDSTATFTGMAALKKSLLEKNKNYYITLRHPRRTKDVSETISTG